jgi:hypothetical protein
MALVTLGGCSRAGGIGVHHAVEHGVHDGVAHATSHQIPASSPFSVGPDGHFTAAAIQRNARLQLAP